MLQQFKNVSLSPVDCGGRVLAVGEIAELHPHGHGVREAVSTGDLLAVVSFVEAPPQDEPDAPADEASSEAPVPADEPDEKPAKATRRGSNQTTKES